MAVFLLKLGAALFAAGAVWYLADKSSESKAQDERKEGGAIPEARSVGQFLSDHAREKMRLYNITEAQVRDTIRFGSSIVHDGKRRYKYNDIVVCVDNKKGDVVTTVWRDQPH